MEVMSATRFDESQHPRSTGGTFAAKGHAEADGVALDAPPPTEAELIDARYHRPTCPTLAQQLEAERDSVGDPSVLVRPDAFDSWTSLSADFGQAHAAELFDYAPDSLGTAVVAGRQEWDAAVGEDDEAKERLIAVGHTPSDFTSPDVATRISARSVRGDLEYDGELLHNAYKLTSHGPTDDANRERVVAAPVAVNSGAGLEPWGELSTAEQLAYLDGYAAATDAVAYARQKTGPNDQDPTNPNAYWTTLALRDRGPQLDQVKDLGTNANGFRRAGFDRAIHTALFQDQVSSGQPVPPVEVRNADAVGGSLRLDNVVAEDRGGQRQYVGKVAAGQERLRANGGTIPWRKGDEVIFDVDDHLRAAR